MSVRQRKKSEFMTGIEPMTLCTSYTVYESKVHMYVLASHKYIKISAVRSLADICFLHVLYFVFSLYFTMKCFSYVIGVNCVSYI